MPNPGSPSAPARVNPPPASMANTLSVGSFNFSSSRSSPRSGSATRKSCFNDVSTFGVSAMACRSVRGQRHDVAIEVLDGDATAIVFHAREEARQPHRRVGRPVAVVAGMQVALRAIHREGQAGPPADAEVERRPAARMPRSIERERQIGLQIGGARHGEAS